MRTGIASFAARPFADARPAGTLRRGGLADDVLRLGVVLVAVLLVRLDADLVADFARPVVVRPVGFARLVAVPADPDLVAADVRTVAVRLDADLLAGFARLVADLDEEPLLLGVVLPPRIVLADDVFLRDAAFALVVLPCAVMPNDPPAHEPKQRRSAPDRSTLHGHDGDYKTGRGDQDRPFP